jgi:aldose 1-epimerase
MSDRDAPFAAGAHPYLRVGTDLVDEASLQLSAPSWLPTGLSQVPIDTESVDGTPYDFRQPQRIGRLHLDYAFTDLERDAEGRAWLSLSAPTGRAVQVWSR